MRTGGAAAGSRRHLPRVSRGPDRDAAAANAAKVDEIAFITSTICAILVCVKKSLGANQPGPTAPAATAATAPAAANGTSPPAAKLARCHVTALFVMSGGPIDGSLTLQPASQKSLVSEALPGLVAA